MTYNAKRLVVEREKNRCEICGQIFSYRDLRGHHINYEYCQDYMDNMMCVCEKCHGLIFALQYRKNRFEVVVPIEYYEDGTFSMPKYYLKGLDMEKLHKAINWGG